MKIKGTKKTVSMTMVFNTILLLACLLILFDLKYMLTRFLRVFEKSEFEFFENLGLLMPLIAVWCCSRMRYKGIIDKRNWLGHVEELSKYGDHYIIVRIHKGVTILNVWLKIFDYVIN